MGYPRRLLGEGEQIEHELHAHWKALVLPVFVFLLDVGVGTYLYVVAGDRWHSALRWGIIAIGLIVLLWGSIIPYLRWRTTLYVLTTDRIIERMGVLSRSGRDIPLSRVNDVSFTHNILERMLRCGTLTVESAGERGQLVWNDVPRVEDVQRELYRLVEEHAKSRGYPVDDGTGEPPPADTT
jgi:membrane protein YdbS with pleckstrin-like domain